MEFTLRDKINHLEQNGLIRDSQYGFRAGRSCLTNMLHFMEIVTKQMDTGLPVDDVYLDFSKTFHIVPHNTLFNKLRHPKLDALLLTGLIAGSVTDIRE